LPLAFNSLSHGQIAFGFFNIDTDMLLLDQYFLFADKFCDAIVDMTDHQGRKNYTGNWHVYLIENTEKIGDLMGAIHGIRYTGFIGEVYRQFPFPEKAEDFKQKPEGCQNRSTVEAIIKTHAKSVQVPVILYSSEKEVEIGVYRFSLSEFQELIQYVWRGGYPQWENEVRPDYLIEMKDKVMGKPDGIFEFLRSENPGI